MILKYQVLDLGAQNLKIGIYIQIRRVFYQDFIYSKLRRIGAQDFKIIIYFIFAISSSNSREYS